MAGHYGHKGRNMFTCIDKDAEVVPGQQANNDGNLFYHAEANCGTGIPCPPYDARKELSCGVHQVTQETTETTKLEKLRT